MKKAIPKLEKKRGRPATGKDPVMSLRMPPEIRERAEDVADSKGITLSKAIIEVLAKHLPKKAP